MGLFEKFKGDKGEEERFVDINKGHSEHNHKYMSNYASTTKYNVVTFLPKSLFEQYRRFANIYFTIMACLSLTPYSPVRPWTTWLPLCLVLGVSMLKEGIEDYKRYVADKKVNNTEIQVLDPLTGKYVTKRWMDVRVGDIVIVNKDEYFPADLLFLSAENEEGTCYVETMNLDGETNLKIKKAPDQTKEYAQDTIASFNGCIRCEPPNPRLYQFTGNLELYPPLVPEMLKLPLNPAAVLLRGCSLRNTHRIFGAVIYSGHETKVFKNATQPPSKRSKVERTVDKIIIFMFSLLLSMCISGALYFTYWDRDNFKNNWYLGGHDLSDSRVDSQYNPEKTGTIFVTNFITVFILYSYLIPISLYVSMEMVKIAQAMVMISRDLDMYHEETDTPALARTSNLNEELGMVNTVLSDKTGTLTRNVMEFFKCSIAGVSYGAGVTEVERSNAARKGQVITAKDDPTAGGYRERFFNFYDERLMGTAWSKTADPKTVEMFFRLLAVCHTVIPDGPTEPDKIKYEAESPDEAALVVAAKVFGFFFYKRTNTTLTVRERTAEGEKDVEYEILNVLEFNSTRKRMSMIIREASGKIILFCKGADTVIYERLDRSHPLNEQYRALTTQHLEDFGSAGLRTLCLSYTELDPTAYQAWQARFMEAKTSLVDREAKVDALSEEVEKDLRLLGATAIEDKLQDGVPDAIAALEKAGIRLWVLTGDKKETAINIGYACSLLTEEMHQFEIELYGDKFKQWEEFDQAGDIENADKLACEIVQEKLDQAEQFMDKAAKGSKFAIIIDGKSLSYALGPILAKTFLRVGLRCSSVICCRVSPLQKAQVTGLVKDKGDITLGIGDGANDVGMIQRAHIGVGISGQEGMQAVQNSDFAIAQFRFLVPLLLVHGRQCYKRLTRMILFFFYKNLIFGTSIYVYNAFNTFSGQFVYNDFYMTLYNVVFTSAVPIIIGIFDKDLDKAICLKYPGLYKQCQRNENFNFKAIALWVISAAYQCAVIMVFILLGCRSIYSDREDGQPYTMWQTGCLMFTCIIITVHLQVVQITEQWNFFHHLFIWLSQLLWWFYLLAYGAFPLYFSLDLYDLFVGVVAPSAQYWFYCLLVPLACVLPDFFFRVMKRQLFPADHEIAQEIQLRLKREGPEDVEKLQKGESPNVLQRIFPNVRPNKNMGYVPPYDPRSKFYGFLSSGNRKTGLQTTTRNPVLQHLDNELTNNPMRSKRQNSLTVPLPAIRPKTSGSSSSNGQAGNDVLPSIANSGNSLNNLNFPPQFAATAAQQSSSSNPRLPPLQYDAKLPEAAGTGPSRLGRSPLPNIHTNGQAQSPGAGGSPANMTQTDQEIHDVCVDALRRED